MQPGAVHQSGEQGAVSMADVNSGRPGVGCPGVRPCSTGPPSPAVHSRRHLRLQPERPLTLALIKSIALLGYVGLVIFGVVRLCRFAPGASRVRLACGRSVDDSVVALAACCMPLASRSLVSQWLIGSVTRGSVRLERRIRGQQNSFRPVFSGDFRTHGDKVVLVGEFGMAAGTQGFLMFWCGAAGAAALACLYAALVQDQPRAWMGVVLGAGLLGACVAIVRIGKSAAADDIAWMTALMREALA